VLGPQTRAAPADAAREKVFFSASLVAFLSISMEPLKSAPSSTTTETFIWLTTRSTIPGTGLGAGYLSGRLATR
jgi:hypothetical protein